MSYKWTGQPETLAWYAANLEADQAAKDYSEAYREFYATGARAGTPQDYAVWHTAHYANVADRLVRGMPVWEA